MFNRFIRAALVASVVAGAAAFVAPPASADGIGIAPIPTGDWVAVVAHITGPGNAEWGWHADFAEPDGPFVWGHLERIHTARDDYMFNTAFAEGESHQEISTTRRLGSAGVTLIENQPASGSFTSSVSAGGFAAGDTFTLVTYIPRGTFSHVIAMPATNATVEVIVARGARMVLGTGTAVTGVGAHAAGVTAGSFTAHQTVPAGSLGTLLSCDLCRSSWRAPNGSKGRITQSANGGSGNPQFGASAASAGVWRFHFAGAIVNPMGGRPVLAAFVDLGPYRSLFK